jgi:plastocyanin domain-containing protein
MARTILRRAALTALLLAVPGAGLVTAQDDGSPREIAIRVDERGYHPGSVRVRPGERVTLVFTRTTSRGCGGTVVIPSRDIRRTLPVDEPVSITLTVPERDRLAFTCGMGMYRGALVVD